jgi:hypothetical protein
MVEFKCPSCGAVLTVTVKKAAAAETAAETFAETVAETAAETKSVKGVKALFPDELKNLLSFEEVEDLIVITPLEFLGTERFSKVASIVRDAGGEYISAGKKSHFTIKKE